MRGVYKAFPCFVSPHPNPLQQEMERELALLNLMAVTLCAGMQPARTAGAVPTLEHGERYNGIHSPGVEFLPLFQSTELNARIGLNSVATCGLIYK